MATECAPVAPRAKRPPSFVLVLAFLASIPVLTRVHDSTRKRWWRAEDLTSPSEATSAVVEDEDEDEDVAKHQEKRVEEHVEKEGKTVSWTSRVAPGKARKHLLQVGHAAVALVATFLTAVFVLFSLAQLSTHHVVVAN